MSIELTPSVLAHHAVLYVDDNAWSRAIFSKVVRSFVAVDVADSAEQALDMLSQRPYSVVVTDQRMPRISGVELCVLVRARFPKVRRVLVTAFGDVDTAADAINRGGVSHFLTKPWKNDLLIHTLKELLTRIELERLVGALQHDIKNREIEIALGEQFGRIVHDLAGIPLPIRTALMDLNAILEDPALPTAARAAVSQQIATLDLVIDHVETILRRSQDLELSPPIRRRYRACTALETARAIVVNRRERVLVDLRCEDVELEFLADLTDITRVLINLLSNAQDAIADSQRDGRIVVQAYRDGSCTAIEVLDNGPGVPPDRRETIFERGVSDRKGGGGTGLGLTICRDLTTMNGGTLELFESPSGGCRFVLRLPAPAVADRTSA